MIPDRINPSPRAYSRNRLPLFLLGGLFLSILTLTSCSSKSMAGSNAAVREVVLKHVEQINAGSPQGILDLFTDDAVVMAPYAPARVGKEAIRASVGDTYNRIRFDMSINIAEIIVAGDWAFVRSDVTGTLSHKVTGDSILDVGKAIHFLHRQSDGKWKIARYMLNSSTPL